MSISKTIISTTLLLTIGLLLFLPIFYTQASLVDETCAQNPSAANCNLCALLRTGKNIINFLIYTIAPALVGIFVAYGGIMFLISGGSEEKVTAGKDAIKVAITGYIIVLLSWLIIQEIFLVFAKNTGWAKLPC
ncbi:hypothetical protein HY061_00635 [Candidatus Azambacteria bacterium]|nr:hypothetical protein [Candidatus Azambacteria bacterium]